ncbi:hypothetical protein SEA_GARDENSTATE_64 [Microbacterium phage GardenState]|uniref:Uncharacterized protein n=1 Tax=Microbacterium phage GardenState TaxID=2776841 RepID=A0A7L8ZDH1_9CAUD|nr:hypothetical protein SEA_GARDENSTATE_64 [Microbacterium phage GardenState]
MTRRRSTERPASPGEPLGPITHEVLTAQGSPFQLCRSAEEAEAVVARLKPGAYAIPYVPRSPA